MSGGRSLKGNAVVRSEDTRGVSILHRHVVRCRTLHPAAGECLNAGGDMTTLLPRTGPMFAGVAREMDEMQNRLRRMFDEGFPAGMAPTEPLGWMPVVEIVEKPDELILTAELPGMTEENIEVFFEDDVLVLRGEKKEEKEEEAEDRRYHLWERTYGEFRRAFALPRTVDPAKIVAEFKNGVLTVRLPKTAKAKAKGQKIAIAKK